VFADDGTKCFFVAFGYTSDALREILDEEIARKLA
jgi:hypothetical protein